MSDVNPTSGKTAASNTEAQQTALAKLQAESGVKVGEELNLSDYLKDVPVSQKTNEELATWASKQRETTRTNLAMWLTKAFGCSLIATFLLMGLAAFNPRVDKALIKDLIPQVITPQVTLLGIALGFYFGAKEK